MPNIWTLRLIGLIALCGSLWGLYGYIHHNGYMDGVNEYKPRLEALQAKINEADKQVRETVQQQEEDHAAIDESHNAHIQAIAKFYETSNKDSLAAARADYLERVRLLGQVREASPDTAPKDQPVDAPTASEPSDAGNSSPPERIEEVGFSGCPVSVEKRCIEDAEWRESVIEFFTVNKFSVE